MIVYINGVKKDLHYTIAGKLLKAGKATLEEEKKQEAKKPKKKIVDTDE